MNIVIPNPTLRVGDALLLGPLHILPVADKGNAEGVSGAAGQRGWSAARGV